MAGAGGVYTGGGATVVMDPPPVVYVKVFHEGSGPARHLGRKAEAVAIMARTLAPKRTGRLASTISVDRNRDEKGQYAFGYAVSAGTGYGYYVHEGTGASPRWPSNRKVMKFPGSLGDTVHRDFVMHPGTPAQPFLQNALVAMVG
jgi:hypothetical protein